MNARLLLCALLFAACREQAGERSGPVREDLPEASRRLTEAATEAHHADHWDEAKRLVDLAVRLDPHNRAAWVQRGDTRTALREHGAFHDFDRAIDDESPDVDLLARRARAHRAAGHREFALADIDAALAVDEDNASLHARRGSALLDLGRNDEALVALNRALSFEGVGWSVLASRAMVHLSAQNLESARADLTAAFDMDQTQTYPVLMLVGLGGDPARLEQATPQDEWTGVLREVLLGKRDPREAVREATRAPHPVLVRERLCEAWTYLGLKAEHEGRGADAYAAYARARETNVPDFFEHVIATARMTALSPADEVGEETAAAE